MINALSKLYGDVWAITPEAHRALCEVVARMPADTREEDEYAGSLVFDGIQHIHVKGVTVSSCPQWAEEMFGLCSMEKIAAQLETAIIRPDVKGVLMVYDTPALHAFSPTSRSPLSATSPGLVRPLDIGWPARKRCMPPKKAR
jgi:hypothetical protein